MFKHNNSHAVSSEAIPLKCFTYVLIVTADLD